VKRAAFLLCAACTAPARPDLAVPQAATAGVWSRGDRLRVQLDEDEVATDPADPRKRTKTPQRDVTAVLVTSPAPLAITLMIDKRVPDPDHATGTSCAAPGAAGTAAPVGSVTRGATATTIACTLATHRLNALVALETGAVARIPLDLIGATPTDTHATADAELEHDRTDFAVTADGTRAGRAIHLKGHIVVDHRRTTAVGHLEGSDGDRSLEVFVDLGPAD
jgi:hypothetical protein